MQQTSAYEVLKAQFEGYGLGSLVDKIFDYTKQGLDENEAYLRLKETEEYKQRFAGNAIRLQKGLRVLSEAEYLSAEERLREQFRAYDLPSGFYDSPDDFSKAIGSDIGGQELQQRLEARKAILTDGAATGVLDYAKSRYGLGEGDLLAFFIDPDRAAPLLTKIAAASQVGAAALRTGWGNVASAEAERLAALGVTASQAEQGFSQAAELDELTAALDGSDGVSRDEITQAIFDQNAPARAKVERKQEERKARFSGGGGFAESRTGFGGLGSANT